MHCKIIGAHENNGLRFIFFFFFATWISCGKKSAGTAQDQNESDSLITITQAQLMLWVWLWECRSK
jgi:hypothetical protein